MRKMLMLIGSIFAITFCCLALSIAISVGLSMSAGEVFGTVQFGESMGKSVGLGFLAACILNTGVIAWFFEMY